MRPAAGFPPINDEHRRPALGGLDNLSAGSGASRSGTLVSSARLSRTELATLVSEILLHSNRKLAHAPPRGVTVPIAPKDATTMTNQFPPADWHLRPDEWPYWSPNTLPSSGLMPNSTVRLSLEPKCPCVVALRDALQLEQRDPRGLRAGGRLERSADNNTAPGSVGSARAADPICAAGRILIARAACHARTGPECCRIFTPV